MHKNKIYIRHPIEWIRVIDEANMLQPINYVYDRTSHVIVAR